ncbi:ScyD/ScyE family protein [Nakamurella leprariae]|uniref:ScyD/ScyE family protein n=1 Tax=Nakamurella leprariae TaxID=2803911 RepID=A0A938YJP3_9ACTN|nr:ScyD/ScyE family protein [Nakamurella leprariae]MBM9469113.1 ScyD/ScyE family protein [Nakamurella leprariae]
MRRTISLAATTAIGLAAVVAFAPPAAAGGDGWGDHGRWSDDDPWRWHGGWHGDWHGGDHGNGETPDPVVVVNGLNNPRGLSWQGRAGGTLVIAEAGRGGDGPCLTGPEGEVCLGLTGSVSTVDRPSRVEGSAPNRVLTGFLSAAAPDGSGATGSDAAAWTETGEVLVPITYGPIPPDLTVPGIEQLGNLVVGIPDSNSLIPYVSIAAAEQALNPDGGAIDSNPYGVLYLGREGDIAKALVADAGANAVWLVTADFGHLDDRGLPTPTFEVWSVYPPEEGVPEFVPTSLAQDKWGNIYVGGLGALAPGYGAVVKYDQDGTELDRWDGFTAVTGIAVDGKYLYVSQLFGPEGPGGPPGGEPPVAAPEEPPAGPPGTVVRVDTRDDTYVSQDVPFPAGLVVDRRGNVFVSAWSLSDEDGSSASEVAPATPPGAVWRIGFPRRGDSQPLPVVAPLPTS